MQSKSASQEEQRGNGLSKTVRTRLQNRRRWRRVNSSRTKRPCLTRRMAGTRLERTSALIRLLPAIGLRPWYFAKKSYIAGPLRQHIISLSFILFLLSRLCSTLHFPSVVKFEPMPVPRLCSCTVQCTTYE